jgi:hypothetical protein
VANELPPEIVLHFPELDTSASAVPFSGKQPEQLREMIGSFRTRTFRLSTWDVGPGRQVTIYLAEAALQHLSKVEEQIQLLFEEELLWDQPKPIHVLGCPILRCLKRRSSHVC